MFSNPSFEGSINSFTLVFHSSKLEDNYKKSMDKQYLREFSMFYLNIFSLFVTICISMYLVYSSFINGKDKIGWCVVTADSLFVAGILLELIVHFVEKLRIIRTVPLALCVFLGCAIVNTGIETSPVLRPGYF